MSVNISELVILSFITFVFRHTIALMFSENARSLNEIGRTSSKNYRMNQIIDKKISKEKLEYDKLTSIQKDSVELKSSTEVANVLEFGTHKFNLEILDVNKNLISAYSFSFIKRYRIIFNATFENKNDQIEKFLMVLKKGSRITVIGKVDNCHYNDRMIDDHVMIVSGSLLDISGKKVNGSFNMKCGMDIKRYREKLR